MSTSEQPLESQESETERRLHVIVVTGERTVFEGPADVLILPAIWGQIAIRRNHAALLAALEPGEMVVRDQGRESDFVISGGFVEVRDNQAVVLADGAERGEDIDLAIAEAARRRARLLTRGSSELPGHAAADLALRLARARITSANRIRGRGRR